MTMTTQLIPIKFVSKGSMHYYVTSSDEEAQQMAFVRGKHPLPPDTWVAEGSASVWYSQDLCFG